MVRMFTLMALLAALAGIPGSLTAQQPGSDSDAKKQAPNFSVPYGMVSREFALGQANAAEVETLCKSTLSPGGKFFIFNSRRILKVIDKPEVMEAIKEMLPHVAAGAPNIKIEFISRTVDQGALRGGQVRGQVGVVPNGGVIVQGQNPGTPGVFRRQTGAGDRGDITQPVAPGGVTILNNGRIVGGAIEVDVLNQRSSGSQLSSQFVLVQANNEGFIEVTQEIPMVDYFTRFIADGSFGAMLSIDPRILNNQNLFPLATGHFEVPDIRWEKAGSRLLVRPTLRGDLITLELMPQISAVVIVDREALRRRGMNTFLTGREQYVTYTQLATTVTVPNGEEVHIGGFEKATPEFGRYFLGGTSGGTTSAGSFSVRATIQK